jgi:hypothetical protein
MISFLLPACEHYIVSSSNYLLTLHFDTTTTTTVVVVVETREKGKRKKIEEKDIILCSFGGKQTKHKLKLHRRTDGISQQGLK